LLFLTVLKIRLLMLSRCAGVKILRDDLYMAMNMKKILLALVLVLVAVTISFAQTCGPYSFRSYSVFDSAAAKGWSGDTFRLSQNYPAQLPQAPAGGYPWEKVDFRTKPNDYLASVLNYCWEGMEDAKFVAQANAKRTWYHAPWMDGGYSGREFLRGLVMDRTSDPKTLSVDQKFAVRNYSLTYYNAEAGYTLGQVWCNPAKPDPAKAKFPVGSVIMKLVFTMADTGQVKHLKGALEWEANLEKSTTPPIDPKEIHEVRLLQINVAVRSNSKEAVNGWVFGVYVYDGRLPGDALKSKFVPLGVQWGNDPGLTPKDVRDDGKSLTQTYINTTAWNQKDPAASLVQNVGYGYRLLGPVGNPATSVMSEASAAAWPIGHTFPPSGVTGDSILHWFRNVGSGQAFEPGQTSLDYALELREGMRNHAIAMGADSLKKALDDEVSEMLGFRAPDRNAPVVIEEEEKVIEYDQGLTGRNLAVFIGFVLLVTALIGLLIWNFVRK
jgi:hypothetical protein